MPLTLYRYMLRELLRVLLLSAAVLVVLVGFAVAIKPLSEGLLGPWSLLKFVLFTMPTVLGFVLPFAVAFSGVVVFFRMAQDNEVLACRASGMSYAAILLPVLVLGLVLTLALFYLSNWVVPSFYLLAERQLEKDLTQMLLTQVNRREAVVRDNLILYADRAEEVLYDAPAPASPEQIAPSRLIRLSGVAVGRLDRAGNLRHEATAEQADAAIYRIGGETWVSIRLTNLMFYDAESGGAGQLAAAGEWEIPPIRLPTLFKDRLQFLSWPELRKLGREPERFDRVQERKRYLAESIASEQTVRQLEAALAGGRAVALSAPATGEQYRLEAPRVERRDGALHLLAQGAHPARLAVTGRSGARRMDAAAIALDVATGQGDDEPSIIASLAEVTVTDPRGTTAAHESLGLPSMRLGVPVLQPLLAQGADELMATAAARYATAPLVQRASEALRLTIASLGRKVMARLHERAASAVGCLLVLLLAAVMSLQTRGSMPLVIYFWTFLIATLAVILARSGENVAIDPERNPLVGYLVIWSGSLTTAAVTAWLYQGLRRN